VASAEGLAGFALLSRLTWGQRELVARLAREVTFARGTTIFNEGQAADGCWLIHEGRVALETFVPGRGPVVVQTLGPGDVLGWSWLVPPYRWQFTARASEQVAAAELDTARLRELADTDPALGYPLALGLMDAVSARLQATRSRAMDLYGSPRGY
jgi:CRP/FNR family transcriptional regulator, cyclic AMP receptor protein